MVNLKDFNVADKIVLALFILSLIILYFLFGMNLSLVLFALFLIIIVAGVWSVFLKGHRHEFFFDTFIKTVIIITLSVITTTVFMVISPYVLFHNSFLNIYLIQYLYVFPTLCVLFGSSYIYSHLLLKKSINYKYIIEKTLIITLLFSLVLSSVLVVGNLYLYENRSEMYNDGITGVAELLASNEELYHSELLIYQEIKDFENDFIQTNELQYAEFSAFDQSHGFCFSSNCFSIVVDKSYDLVVDIINSNVIDDSLEIAEEEYEYVSSGNALQDYGSLEDYATYLKDYFSTLNISLNQETLSDFEISSYDELDEIKESLFQDSSTGIGHLLDSTENSEEILYNSQFYVFEHTRNYQILIEFVAKILWFSETQSNFPDLYLGLYENIDIDESVESKIIRYRLLINQFDIEE